MKNLTLSLSMMVIAFALNAQQCVWLESNKGSLIEAGTDIAADNTGNSVSCGYFTSDLMWVGEQFLIRNSISRDAYVIKSDPVGNMIWMDNPGGPISQKANAIIADSYGNTYVTGLFEGGFTFGSSYLEALNGEDCMLLKYDSSGNQIWGLSIGSYGLALGSEITCDSEGYIYVVGWYDGNDIFIEDTIIHNHGYIDIFLAKYSPDGALMWANCFGGNERDYIHGIVTDALDNVYICGGFYSDEISFGNFTFLNQAYGRSAFITKLNSDGNILWADVHSDGYDQDIAGVSIDDEGGIFAAGYFKNTFTFGSDTFTTEGSQFDIMLFKYNSNFEPQWAKHIYSSSYDRVNDITHDPDGNIYIAADYDGDIIIGNNLITNHGDMDFLISKFDTDGELIWVRVAGGSEADECHSIALIEPWFVGFTGFFSSDYIYIGQHLITNQAMEDAFYGTLYTYLTAEIDDNRTSYHADFYPNPFEDEIFFIQSVYKAELYNLNGQRIISERNTNILVIGEDIPAAIYVLSITTLENQKPQTYKILKR